LKINENAVVNKIVDCLFPPACPVCGGPLAIRNAKREKICIGCSKKLEYVSEPFCMKCGKQLTKEEHEYCMDCKKIRHFYTRGTAVFAYTAGIKKSIYNFKYHGKCEYASFYGEQAYKKCGSLVNTWNVDVLIPVPLHTKKQRKRGYNQAELIAVEFGRHMDIPVDPTLLIRSENTTPMKELNDTERRKNVKKAFNIRKNVVRYKKVLIVDDIYTTGATIDECARVLLEHGAEEVYFLCLCIGKGL
jgi:ComF family protein